MISNWKRLVTSLNYLENELIQLIQNDAETWRFLQEGSLDGVWYWDLEKPDQEWMSPEFWTTLGVDPNTKQHDPSEWQDIIFADDLAIAMENFHAHCANPDHSYDQIVRYRHANGSTVWIRCRGLAIRDDSGKAIRMLGAHTDLTPMKRLEENARAGWRAAENANAELKSFAFSVSHDMKAPTNTLKLLLHELRLQNEGRLDEDSQEILTMSLETITRMQGLIENVLDYTRVIGPEPVFEPVDLRHCAESAIFDLMADIAASGADVIVDDLPEVTAVASQMNALFQNLISNAIKYRRHDVAPVIRISASNDPDQDVYDINFMDNGIGIAPKNQDRIFRLFQRLHTHDDIDGAGIGLPMCQRIVLNHRGNLRVNSQIGSGATFTVSLPRSHQ